MARLNETPLETTTEEVRDKSEVKTVNGQGITHKIPSKRLLIESGYFDRLTHYLFRYPAKFHPPVIKKLIQQYSRKGDRIYDPFCGSGSLLVEAAASGRHAVGSDVDPLAVFVSRIKTNRYNISHLTKSHHTLLDALQPLCRSEIEYQERKFNDLSIEDAQSVIQAEHLWTPAIPNLFHWFRRYVVVDLARIYRVIHNLAAPTTHRNLFRLCFASMIRASSNADPVPISGLEVTAHMKRKDISGRLINPFALYQLSLRKALAAVT